MEESKESIQDANKICFSHNNNVFICAYRTKVKVPRYIGSYHSNSWLHSIDSMHRLHSHYYWRILPTIFIGSWFTVAALFFDISMQAKPYRYVCILREWEWDIRESRITITFYNGNAKNSPLCLFQTYFSKCFHDLSESCWYVKWSSENSLHFDIQQ